MAFFNEHALEMSIMELFQQEGYIYTNGEEIHKEVSDVLLRDDCGPISAVATMRPESHRSKSSVPWPNSPPMWDSRCMKTICIPIG